MKSSFLIAQLGARMHYAVPRILHGNGMLARLYTDFSAARGWPRLLNVIPDSVRPHSVRKLLGRFPDGLPSEKVTSFNDLGLEYARRLRRSRSASDSTRTYLWAGKEFCERVLKHGQIGADAVYTFNSAGLEIMGRAKKEGRKAVMEQTIAPKRIEIELLAEEQKRFPDWESDLLQDEMADDFILREEAEWNMADLILCGSEFVRDGIARSGGAVEKCVVVPYGVDLPRKAKRGERQAPSEETPHPGPLPKAEREKNRPLHVLTVGAVGLRKGSPYVCEAAKRLKGRVEFRMVGPVGISPKAQELLREQVDLVGPVPRSEISRHFEWADVFLLPSICEGSATVVYEAIAYGLPVICTPNTGSVIRDGLDGFLVPAGDVEILVDRLDQIAGDTELRTRMIASVFRRSREFTIASYGERLIDALTRQTPSVILSGSSISHS